VASSGTHSSSGTIINKTYATGAVSPFNAFAGGIEAGPTITNSYWNSNSDKLKFFYYRLNMLLVQAKCKAFQIFPAGVHLSWTNDANTNNGLPILLSGTRFTRL
jgi:hypothetical protein